MTTRIVENFWDKIKTNEPIIKRCFVHHFKRHPDPEGRDASYNNLLIRLNELKVFERFELRKLVIAAKAEGLIGDRTLTPELLKEIGINVEKKWEQFLYKWIENIVNYEYNRNGNRSRRFVNGETLTDYGTPKEDVTSWIEDREEAKTYEQKYAEYGEERRGRLFPPTFSNRYIAGEEGFDNQLEAFSASELRSQIIKRLTGKNDRAIFDLMEQGISEKEIGEKLDFSKQYVGSVIRKIRGITTQLCPELCQ